MKNITIITAFVLFVNFGYAQSTYADNDPGANSPVGFLGWDDSGNQNLDIFQNNILRKRFTSLGTFTGINGYSVSNASRMYLSENGNFQTPYSMLHMGSNMTTSFLQRPWMNVGVTMTSSQDLLHLGIIDVPVSSTNYHQIDAVLAWGCNPDSGIAGPDNFRFLFLQPTTVYPPTDAGTQQGRETMRITPMGNVGIGDFSHMPNGLNEQPTQRLDVDGTARLRQTPSNTPNALITGVEANGVGDYVLNHLEFNNNPNSFLAGNGTWQAGTNVCDWNMSGQDLNTGHPSACHTGYVGIGRATPARKLDVLVGDPSLIGSNSDFAALRAVNSFTTTSTGRNAGVMGVSAELNPVGNIHTNIGGYFAGANATYSDTVTANYGVIAIANDQYPGWNQSSFSYGVRAYAAKAQQVYGVYSTAMKGEKRNIGVLGFASSPYVGAYNIGVYGIADGHLSASYNIGVYGQATVATNSHAGYFAGSVVDMQTPLNPSDEMLKENIEEFDGGLSVINQLAPKKYNYKLNEYGHLGLPEGSQIGFIAQDIAEVLPELTQTVVSPPEIDSLGVEIEPSVEFTAMSYTGLIPILVSAVKEQQTIIENQNDALAQMMDQLAAMQQQINDCCNSGDGNRSMPGGIIQPQDFNNQKSIEGGNELYQNIPNPFRESTTISYSLEEGGRVQLNIYDKTGKVVTTLTDANQGPGRYSEVWNANGMPAGVYHYALYVNGELLVKRAIKLQE